eukprot:9185977-Pyramimonas_sp.AAC.1
MADRFQARVVGASLGKSRRAFQQWATKMWKQAPGVLHRHVKQQGDAVQIPKDDHVYKATAFADPTAIMGRRADEWGAIWGDPKVAVNMLLQGVEKVRRVAQEESLPPIELAQLDRPLPSTSAKKAKGVDALGPLEIQGLPEEGRAEMVNLLNAIEEN